MQLQTNQTHQTQLTDIDEKDEKEDEYETKKRSALPDLGKKRNDDVDTPVDKEWDDGGIRKDDE